MRTVSRDWNDAFPSQIGSVAECGWNVLKFQRRVLVKDTFRRLTGRQIVANYRPGNSRASEAHSSVHYLGIGSEVGFPVHGSSSVSDYQYSTVHPFVPNVWVNGGPTHTTTDMARRQRPVRSTSS